MQPSPHPAAILEKQEQTIHTARPPFIVCSWFLQNRPPTLHLIPPTTLKLHWAPAFIPPLARPAFPAFQPCTDNRHTLSQAIMMIIDYPPCKAQKAELARFAHPPPLSYIGFLKNIASHCCAPACAVCSRVFVHAPL